jgi:hypothetical protein
MMALKHEMMLATNGFKHQFNKSKNHHSFVIIFALPSPSLIGLDATTRA